MEGRDDIDRLAHEWGLTRDELEKRFAAITPEQQDQIALRLGGISDAIKALALGGDPSVDEELRVKERKTLESAAKLQEVAAKLNEAAAELQEAAAELIDVSYLAEMGEGGATMKSDEENS